MDEIKQSERQRGGLMSLKSVAEYLDVSVKSLYNRYTKDESFPKAVRLPSSKGKGQLRFYRYDVEEWAAKFAR